MNNRGHGSQENETGSGSEKELKKRAGLESEELKKIVVDADVDIPDDRRQTNEQQRNITRR